MKSSSFSRLNIVLILTFLILVFTSCIRKEIVYEDPTFIDAPEEINLGKVRIPGGTFLMGSPPSEPYHNAETQFEVTLDTFYLSPYEITNAQFASFLNQIKIGTSFYYEEGEYPDQFLMYGPTGLTFMDGEYKLIPGYENHPVNFVTWYGAYEFARFVGGRLPTEAEWEYAARAGTSTPFNTGTCLSDNEANYYWDIPYVNCENSGSEYPGDTQEVGTYAANAFGLFDMHGNVDEWCNDWYGTYPTGPQKNPLGPDAGEYKIRRGGSWHTEAGYCRSADRKTLQPWNRHAFIGFRVAFYD